MKKIKTNVHLFISQFIFHIFLTYLAIRLVINMDHLNSQDLGIIYFYNYKVIAVVFISILSAYFMIAFEQENSSQKKWDVIFYLIYFICAFITILGGYEDNKIFLLIPILFLTIKYGTKFGMIAAIIYSVFLIISDLYIEKSDMSQDIMMCILFFFFSWVLGTSIESATNFANTAEKLTLVNNELAIQIDKNSELGLLAAGIAHEIRNPLTGIKGFVQHMLYSKKLPDEEILRIMESDVNRIEKVISDFLAFSKPKASIYNNEDIISTVDYCKKLIESYARYKNVNISFDYNEQIMLNTDHDKLKHVFINIFKNSIEAFETINKEEGKNIEISVNQIIDSIEIRVSDNGCGMNDEVLKKLALPFFTTKSSGTGLGLLVSYNIIKALGGKMNFQSVLGEGTTVIISLPK